MQQSENSVYSFLIGVSVALIMYGCGQADDANSRPVVIDFVYKNETSQMLEFKMRSNNSSEPINIVLLPDEKTTVSNQSETDQEVDPTSCCQEWLDDFLGSNGNTIIISDTLFVVHDGEKSGLIDAYNGIAIDQNHFEYSYTFNNDDLEGASRIPN